MGDSEIDDDSLQALAAWEALTPSALALRVTDRRVAAFAGLIDKYDEADADVRRAMFIEALLMAIEAISGSGDGPA